MDRIWTTSPAKERGAVTSEPFTSEPFTGRFALANLRLFWGVLFGVAIVWSLFQADVFAKELVNFDGWPLLARFFRAALSPDLSPSFLWLTLDATVTTLAFAVSGTALSVVIGIGTGILASEVWWRSIFPRHKGRHWAIGYRAPWLIIRGLLAFLRAIHEIVWGLFFVNIIGLDPLTAVLAIGIPFGAVMGKVFSEILDDAPKEALVALQNSGVAPSKAILYTLLPQIFPDLMAYSFYRLECAIRAAAVLGIIGAGGLGHEIFLSLQTLKYEQIWTLFFALFLLNGAADFWSGLLRRRLQSVDRTQRPQARAGQRSLAQVQERQSVPTSLVLRGSVIGIALLIPFSFRYIQPDIGRLFSSQTLEHLVFIGERSFPLHFGALSVSEWLRLINTTMAMSVLATFGAGLLALPLSYAAANNFMLPGGLLYPSHGRWWYRLIGWATLLLSRGLLLVTRSVPPPIWALVALFVLFPGILPGALALGLYTLGVLGRLVAETVENLDERPLTALKSLGADGGQVFAYGVLPATFPRFIGYLLYRWEETIRATVVIGLVGAGGLGRLLTQQLVSFNYQGMLTTLVVFVMITFVVDLVSTVARRSFRS